MPSRTVAAWNRSVVRVMALVVAVLVAGCLCKGKPKLRANGTRNAVQVDVAESVYKGGLAKGWYDYGWSQREVDKGGPAKVNFSSNGGWIVAKPGLAGAFGGLVFRMKAPREYGDFLEVRLESNQKTIYPRIALKPEHVAEQPDGWVEVLIPAKQLNPEGLPFDRIVFRAAQSVGNAWIFLDDIALLKIDPSLMASAKPQGTRDIVMSVDCRAKPQPVSPMIFGIAFDPRLDRKTKHQFEMGAPARRWGGNQTSRYNWELGNAFNPGKDWYFENVDFVGIPGWSWADFLGDQRKHAMKTALTIPMMGWVAKDTTSYGFPVAQFGPQQSVDPYRNDPGNGLKPDGSKIAPGPPMQTSVATSPESARKWIEAIRALDAKNGGRSVDMYILDNEPALWDSTHRDVHPLPLTYDELLEKTIAFGSVVRAADPDALIAGPAEWGWPAFFYSAKDSADGLDFKPDRTAHGDVPILPWYLKKLAEHEAKTGTRILDVVDVHFYPSPQNLGLGEDGGIDAQTAALRIRSTRALWDPSYIDEGWIKENVRLLPRLRQWINENYPGRGISIGEWSYGAENHMSAGLAAAETLGRFVQAGLTSAFYWTYPPQNSPVFWAFRAYRNFDGKGGRFLDGALPTVAPADTSLYASIDPSGTHVVLVALNLLPDATVKPTFILSGCNAVTSQHVYEFTGAPTGFTPKKATLAGGNIAVDTLASYSITVFDLLLAPKQP
jgi:hypothetical protein